MKRSHQSTSDSSWKISKKMLHLKKITLDLESVGAHASTIDEDEECRVKAH
jgi:hypothetical protein